MARPLHQKGLTDFGGRTNKGCGTMGYQESLISKPPKHTDTRHVTVLGSHYVDIAIADIYSPLSIYS